MPIYVPPVLSRRDRAILAYALGQSAAETGRTVGVDPRTVRRWRTDPDFRAEVARVRRRLLDQAIDTLTREGAAP